MSRSPLSREKGICALYRTCPADIHERLRPACSLVPLTCLHRPHLSVLVSSVQSRQKYVRLPDLHVEGLGRRKPQLLLSVSLVHLTCQLRLCIAHRLTRAKSNRTDNKKDNDEWVEYLTKVSARALRWHQSNNPDMSPTLRIRMTLKRLYKSIACQVLT